MLQMFIVREAPSHGDTLQLNDGCVYSGTIRHLQEEGGRTSSQAASQKAVEWEGKIEAAVTVRGCQYHHRPKPNH